MNFDETIREKMETANDLQITRFLFDYQGKTYFVKWRDGKWSEPIEMTYL
jgi:hypothetical protein